MFCWTRPSVHPSEFLFLIEGSQCQLMAEGTSGGPGSSDASSLFPYCNQYLFIYYWVYPLSDIWPYDAYMIHAATERCFVCMVPRFEDSQRPEWPSRPSKVSAHMTFVVLI